MVSYGFQPVVWFRIPGFLWGFHLFHLAIWASPVFVRKSGVIHWLIIDWLIGMGYEGKSSTHMPLSFFFNPYYSILSHIISHFSYFPICFPKFHGSKTVVSLVCPAICPSDAAHQPPRGASGCRTRCLGAEPGAEVKWWEEMASS